MTGNGDEIAEADLQDNLRQSSGSLSTVWNGGRNPEHIQAYLHWDEPGGIFCEITFFPQDFDGESFNLMEFLSMLSKLTVAARSDEFYLRYEDGSWRHGQHEKDCVILSSSK